MKKENNLVIFQQKQIRRKWYKNEWWFSVIDVISVLVNSLKPSKNVEPLKMWLALVGQDRLDERVTTEISKNEKPTKFTQHKIVAKRGGGVASKARIETEKEIGKSVVTNQNYLK